MSDTPTLRAATSIAEAETEERELAARVCAGDERAFARVMQRHWDGLFRYVQRLLERHDAAEDVAQEAFVRLWDRRTSWRRRDTLRPVLYRIARNLALNERRRWTIFRRWAGRYAQPERDPSPTPLEHAETRDLEAAAARAIEALPERRREIFLLVRYSQMSYREAAEVLGISPQTVANQMSQAMQQLRELLGDRLHEPSGSTRSIAFPPARSG
jgi:RNA polymerase sigma-70 factor, ECF subfamily